MYLSNFFWGQNEGKNKHHWSSWGNMSYPYSEGGVGFKRLQDICSSFEAKRWWRFRSEDNLWTEFLLAKYCPRSNPISKVQNTKDSSIWRTLLQIREQIEHNIMWLVNEGNILFWWDNWSNLGPIHQLCNSSNKPGNRKVCDFIRNSTWNSDLLESTVPQYFVDNILKVEIGDTQCKDKAI